MDGQPPEKTRKQEVALDELAGELLPHELERAVEAVELSISYDLKKGKLVAQVGIVGIPFWKLVVYLSVLASSVKYLWN